MELSKVRKYIERLLPWIIPVLILISWYYVTLPSKSSTLFPSPDKVLERTQEMIKVVSFGNIYQSVHFVQGKGYCLELKLVFVPLVIGLTLGTMIALVRVYRVAILEQLFAFLVTVLPRRSNCCSIAIG